VARIAIELGRELGLQSDDLGDIYLAGLLHDVGKIGIRDAILDKPGPLSPEEFEEVKQHVTIGYKILSDLRPIRNLLRVFCITMNNSMAAAIRTACPEKRSRCLRASWQWPMPTTP